MEPEPRLLHRTHGYTTNPLVALRGELEAVPRDEQDWITLAAHNRTLAKWRKCSERMLAALEKLVEHADEELRAGFPTWLPNGSPNGEPA